jgi:hypothetical protein
MRLTWTIPLLVSIIALFTGCGTTGKQIIVPTYIAPKQEAKIKGLMADTTDTKGKFLSFSINPKVSSSEETKLNDAMKKRVISITKEAITKSNYILINPVLNDSTNTLSMSVTSYHYENKCESDTCSVNGELQMNFQITRGGVDYYIENYDAKVLRSSERAKKQFLPSEATASAEMVKECVEKFIYDISPSKTNQLRELKSLPSELSYVIDMAPKGNYENLIEAMEGYKGEKSVGYYYNLAVFYEALAASSEDLSMLKKAKINYTKAMERGGSSDAIVVATKAKFDNFYKMLDKLIAQQDKNKAKEKAINEDYAIDD